MTFERRTWLTLKDLDVGDRFRFFYNPYTSPPNSQRLSSKVYVKQRGNTYSLEGVPSPVYKTGLHVAIVMA